MSNSSDSNYAPIQNWCNVQAAGEEVEFIWTISNFDSHEEKKTSLFSPIFSATTNDKFKWHLHCKPDGENEEKDTVSLYLYLIRTDDKDEPKTVFAECTFFILQSIWKKTQTFPPGLVAWRWAEFIRKDESFRKKYLKNNELTIRCNILFSVIENGDISFHLSKPSVSESCLSEDLALLFDNRDFSDVVVSVKNKDFHVHKNILAARSSVFAAMFKHNMKESEENRVVVEDIDKEVMGEILRYIYTGNCRNLKKFAVELMGAAEKYALNGLKMLCTKKLVETLSVENSMNMLVLADLYRVPELKSRTIQFIVVRFSEVVVSMSWKNKFATHSELINEVCSAVADRLADLKKKSS